jgi:hypothetical protein
VWNLFFYVFTKVVISWITKSQYVQAFVALWVEAMNNATTAAGHETSGSHYLRIGNEL